MQLKCIPYENSIISSGFTMVLVKLNLTCTGHFQDSEPHFVFIILYSLSKGVY